MTWLSPIPKDATDNGVSPDSNCNGYLVVIEWYHTHGTSRTVQLPQLGNALQGESLTSVFSKS